MIIVPTAPAEGTESRGRVRLDEVVGELLRLGLSDVDVHLRHRRVDGEWRDVVVVELTLGDES